MKTLTDVLAGFDEKFTPDWWMGFGTSQDIDQLGIQGIRSYISSSFSEVMEGLAREIETGKHTFYTHGTINLTNATEVLFRVESYNEGIKSAAAIIRAAKGERK